MLPLLAFAQALLSVQVRHDLQAVRMHLDKAMFAPCGADQSTPAAPAAGTTGGMLVQAVHTLGGHCTRLPHTVAVTVV
jgi:hypothetical protein